MKREILDETSLIIGNSFSLLVVTEELLNETNRYRF